MTNDNFDMSKFEGLQHFEAVALLACMKPALMAAKLRLQQTIGEAKEKEIYDLGYWISELDDVVARVN